MPTVPATLEAEARGFLEPWNLKPAWATGPESHLNKTKQKKKSTLLSTIPNKSVFLIYDNYCYLHSITTLGLVLW
jgi:hypothetical protein